MIRFKAIKYKDIQKSKELLRAADESDDMTECFSFILRLVAEWDFVDIDTGEPLPVSIGSLEEFSIDQFGELTKLFNQEFRDTKLERTTPAVPMVGKRPQELDFVKVEPYITY